MNELLSRLGTIRRLVENCERVLTFKKGIDLEREVGEIIDVILLIQEEGKEFSLDYILRELRAIQQLEAFERVAKEEPPQDVSEPNYRTLEGVNKLVDAFIEKSRQGGKEYLNTLTATEETPEKTEENLSKILDSVMDSKIIAFIEGGNTASGTGSNKKQKAETLKGTASFTEGNMKSVLKTNSERGSKSEKTRKTSKTESIHQAVSRLRRKLYHFPSTFMDEKKAERVIDFALQKAKNEGRIPQDYNKSNRRWGHEYAPVIIK
jgi:hypothetical protein